jgi:general secretion pathway protein G
MSRPVRHHCPSARRRHGFTLVELVVTVAIVLILSSAAMPLADIAMRRSKEQDLRTALRQIRTAIDDYKAAVDEGKVSKNVDDSGYPPSLDALVKGVNDISRPELSKIYFLRRIPRDPFAPADLEAAKTWATRGYDSPPDEPREGRDVFDVASRSEELGLNGVPYNKW